MHRNAFEKSRSPDTMIDQVSRARAVIASSVAAPQADVTRIGGIVAGRNARSRHGTGQ